MLCEIHGDGAEPRARRYRLQARTWALGEAALSVGMTAGLIPWGMLADRIRTDVPVLVKGGYSKRDSDAESPTFIVESVTPFTERAPIVRPWKPCSQWRIRGRPVAARAC
mgnify:CR=1 FL=1